MENIGVRKKKLQKKTQTLTSFQLALNWPFGIILGPTGVDFQVKLQGTKKSIAKVPETTAL